VPAILAAIADRGLRVFLPVMKQFGPVASPGLLSFPLPGTSVALDFPWQGDRLFRLLDELDARVADCGGRVYIAKDARMSGEAFRRFYPRWEELERHRDPAIRSHFWHRVTR
jgi:FAD/FMN-containing dehydrogenase